MALSASLSLQSLLAYITKSLVHGKTTSWWSQPHLMEIPQKQTASAPAPSNLWDFLRANTAQTWDLLKSKQHLWFIKNQHSPNALHHSLVQPQRGITI